ncbi:uncharacterized protein LOC134036859 isoform X3 [Osmerus eperlanus]|uniref:uncharacterized protein LOC134036859 isoform X3 n=1 Tax=Osmerus eperlanus TaxID=29151 RepID=UPI002E0F9446
MEGDPEEPEEDSEESRDGSSSPRSSVLWEKVIQHSVFLDLSEDDSVHLSDLESSFDVRLSRPDSALSETSVHLSGDPELLSSESSDVSSQGERVVEGRTKSSATRPSVQRPNTAQPGTPSPRGHQDPGDTSDEDQEELPYDGDLDSRYLDPLASPEENSDAGGENSGTLQSSPNVLDLSDGPAVGGFGDTTPVLSPVESGAAERVSPAVSQGGTGSFLDPSRPTEGLPTCSSPVFEAPHPDITQLLLRHFSQDQLLLSGRLIEAETLPEVSLLESMDETLLSRAPGGSCTGRPSHVNGSAPQRSCTGRPSHVNGSAPQRSCTGRPSHVNGSAPQRSCTGRPSGGSKGSESLGQETVESHHSRVSSAAGQHQEQSSGVPRETNLAQEEVEEEEEEEKERDEDEERDECEGEEGEEEERETEEVEEEEWDEEEREGEEDEEDGGEVDEVGGQEESVEEGGIQNVPLARTRSFSELKYGQGQVHYRRPDFSKVAPKVKIPKTPSGLDKPLGQSPTPIMRALSSPGMLGMSSERRLAAVDVISRVLEDSLQPADRPHAFTHLDTQTNTSPALVHHLQAEYDKLLTKYAEAENLIDQMRLGAKPQAPSELNLELEYAGLQEQLGLRSSGSHFGSTPFPTAPPINAKTPPLSPHCPSPFAELVSAEKQNNSAEGISPAPSPVYKPSPGSAPSLAPSPAPIQVELQSDGERMTAELRDIIREFLQKVEDFRSSLRTVSITLEEQQMVFRSMVEAQDHLERGYLSRREEHRALEMQTYLGVARNTGTFDPDRLVEGEIFRVGMYLEDIKELIDRNMCEQLCPPPSSSTPPTPLLPRGGSSTPSLGTPSPPPAPSLHEGVVLQEPGLGFSPWGYKTEAREEEDQDVCGEEDLLSAASQLDSPEQSSSSLRAHIHTPEEGEEERGCGPSGGRGAGGQAGLGSSSTETQWSAGRTISTVLLLCRPVGAASQDSSLLVEVSCSSQSVDTHGRSDLSSPQRIVSSETDSGFGSCESTTGLSPSKINTQRSRVLTQSNSSSGLSGSDSEGSCSQLQTTIHPADRLQTSTHPADRLQTTIHPADRLQTTIHPVDRLQTTIHPADRLQTTIHPVDRLQTTIHPADRLQTTIHPADRLQTSTHPADRLQTTIHPEDRLQTTIHPADRLQTSTQPAQSLQNSTHPVDSFLGDTRGSVQTSIQPGERHATLTPPTDSGAEPLHSVQLRLHGNARYQADPCPSHSVAMDTLQPEGLSPACPCHSEALVSLQQQVSRLQRDLEEGLTQLPQLSQRMDLLSSHHRQDRGSRSRPRPHPRPPAHSVWRSAGSRTPTLARDPGPVSTLLKVDDWISSDMDPSRSRGTQQHCTNSDSGRSGTLQYLGSPPGGRRGSPDPHTSTSPGKPQSEKHSSRGSEGNLTVRNPDLPLSNPSPSPSPGPSPNPILCKQGLSYSNLYRAQLSAVLDAEMENLFSKGRFSLQKPLLQVNYGSSCSLPAGFKVREPMLQSGSVQRKRSAQSDTALLPSNVYFQLHPALPPSRTGSRTSRHRGSKVSLQKVSRHRGSKEEEINRKLDQAIEAARSMKKATDRMARSLSADLAKSQLHRKLHGRKHITS